jgi:hypothetical protein
MSAMPAGAPSTGPTASASIMSSSMHTASASTGAPASADPGRALLRCRRPRTTGRDRRSRWCRASPFTTACRRRRSPRYPQVSAVTLPVGHPTRTPWRLVLGSAHPTVPGRLTPTRGARAAGRRRRSGSSPFFAVGRAGVTVFVGDSPPP